VRVLLDARFASGAIHNGQSMYLHKLLLNLGYIDLKNDYDLIYNTGDLQLGNLLPTRFRFKRIPNLPYKLRSCIPFQDVWWRCLVQLNYLFKTGNQVVCSAINVGPLPIHRGIYIAVAHDLDYIDFPEFYTRSHAKKNIKNTHRSVKRADHIIAISQATKNQILKHFDYPEDQISVIHHGYDSDLFTSKISVSDRLRVRKQYSLPEKFIFSLGSLSPKKNITTLLNALAILKLSQQEPIHCYLAGGFDHITEKTVSHTIQNLGLSGSVHLLGRIPEEDLPVIYNLASAFAFPSIAEGFGLPIIEAMACGCPVITSNTSCMPEIADQAAIFISPTDSKALSDSIQLLVQDDSLNSQLIEKGLNRAKCFSWAKTAGETLKIITLQNQQ